jgi:hypothetical protein
MATAIDFDALARQLGGTTRTQAEVDQERERAAAAAVQASLGETRVTPAVQSQRDQGAVQIPRQEEAAILRRLAAGDPRAQTDLDSIRREIARMQGTTAPEAGGMQPSLATSRRVRADTRAGAVPTAIQQRAAIPGEVPRAIGASEPQAMPEPPPGLIDRIVGELEAAGALVSGATTAPLSAANAAVGEFVRQLMSGRLGTAEGNVAGEQAVKRGLAAGTYTPRTELGREYAGTIAGALQQVPPYIPVVGQAAVPGAAAARQIASEVRAGAQEARAATTARSPARPTAVPAERVEPPFEGAPAVSREPMQTPRVPELEITLEGAQPTAAAAPTEVTLRGAPTPATPGRAAMGAAGVAPERERVAIAATMPVPFEGRTGLTAGQRTRDFTQLQFEKESAKLADIGEPLRERVQAQTANFIANFDALIDLPQPIARESREVGRVVTDAIANRAEVKRREIRKAYADASAAGEMQEPVQMGTLANGLAGMSSMEGLVPMISAVRREAARLGAIVPDEAGNLQAGSVSVNDAEKLRQFVNQATDWSNRREAIYGRQINSLIDQATDGAGGELYRNARKLRSQFADEFENVGLTAKLIGTKRGTSERQVALEDVFDKVIMVSPVEEMNKVRGTLLRAGPGGQQAWADLKSSGIDYIKRKALSASERDAAGNPLLSPAQLQRTVQALDREGKLEALYGKQQAQTLRDLAELSSVIYTAPPGAINTSNTASALQVALDSLVTFGMTGVPAPVATTLQQAGKYLRNRAVKKRIDEALAPPKQ